MGTEKSGWLYKKGKKHGWKTRYMIADRTSVSYYAKEGKLDDPLGVIDYKTITSVGRDDAQKKHYVFNIIIPDRTYYFSCANGIERDQWISALEERIQVVKGTMTPNTRKQTISTGVSFANDPVNGNASEEESSQKEEKKPSRGAILRSASKLRLEAAKEKAKKIGTGAKKVNEKIKKQQKLLKGKVIGKIFVSVLEAKFEDFVDPNLRPYVYARFERQEIESSSSKNSQNPHWKESFSFDVIDLTSRFRLSIFDKKSAESDDSEEMGNLKLSVKDLEDEKQRKQWHELVGPRKGQVLIQIRFERDSSEKETEVDIDEENLVGTAQLTVIEAKGLKERPGGAPRNAFVHVKFGNQEWKTEPVSGTNSPEWNFVTALRVEDVSQMCVFRLLDMEAVSRTHLGTVTLSPDMLQSSSLQLGPVDKWIKLQLEPEDDPKDNHVGGELHVQYKYKPVIRVGGENGESNSSSRSIRKRNSEKSISSVISDSESKSKNLRDEPKTIRSDEEHKLPKEHDSPIENRQISSARTWECTSCGTPNALRSPNCALCSTKRPSEILSRPASGVMEHTLSSEAAESPESMTKTISGSTWECPNCNTTFSGNITTCSVCDNRRVRHRPSDPPPSASPVSSSAAPLSPFSNIPKQTLNSGNAGMWDCLTCGQKNTARAVNCTLCCAKRGFVNTPKGNDGTAIQRKVTLPSDTVTRRDTPNLSSRKDKDTPSRPKSRDMLPINKRNSSPNETPRNSASGNHVSPSPRTGLTSDRNSTGNTNPFDDLSEENKDRKNDDPDNPFNSFSDGHSRSSGSPVGISRTVSRALVSPGTPTRASSTRSPRGGVQRASRASMEVESGVAPPSLRRAPSAASGLGTSARQPSRLRIGASKYEAVSPQPTAKRQSGTISGPFSVESALPYDKQEDVLYKVIIIGDSGVGKTNILSRWMTNRFIATTATINVEFASKSFNVDGQIVKVQLWDTAGQEHYRSITRSFYRKSQGAIVVYDITSVKTFDQLYSWIRDVKDAVGNENTQILLVGNKTDLESEREVSTEDGIAFAKEHSLNFMETSAFSGDNVDRAFQIVLQDIHTMAQRLKAKEDGVRLTSRSTVVIGANTTTDSTCCIGSSTNSRNGSNNNNNNNNINNNNNSVDSWSDPATWRKSLANLQSALFTTQ